MKSKLIPLSFFVYIVATGISFIAFRSLLPGAEALINPAAVVYEDGSLVINPGEPKTEICPINGDYFTITEKTAWEKRRPLLVMIENHQESRPQSGLGQADLVYEAVAEGGITRFMGVFYCDAVSQDNIVGPVRSARTYYLDWASEYSKNPLYAHVGGANTPNKANALGQIVDYGWGGENDLNQFALTVNECWRDYSRLGRQVATEHTMYCSTEALWKIGANRGWAAKGEDGELWSDQFTPWKFADPKPVSSPEIDTIAFDFWDYPQYSVSWKYDPESNQYLRSNGGSEHLDNNTDTQLTARVVIIQYVTETGPIDDHKHMLYGTIGTGNALVFQNGQVIKATWSKSSRTDRTIFLDPSKKEIEFARGKIWIEALPKGNQVDY